MKKLREYARKRNFEGTPEPQGGASRTRTGNRFVIQKHAARRLHYDFRLELGGTLKSWAVPKGFPFGKGEKHLAVQVEDHPLEYAHFEGIIPAGQYGGGTVMIWDTGTYDKIDGDLDRGKLHFALHGHKLHGEWRLVRIRRPEQNQWLLIKSGENLRPIGKKRDNQSALTGRTMAAISREADATWQSDNEKSEYTLEFVPPMKARLVSTPPAGKGWSYELKFDGYRALALKENHRVDLLSTNKKSFNARFPEIVEGLVEFPARTAVLDGEIVALDSEGRPSFQALQARELGTERPPLLFYVFDLLHLDAEDFQKRPLHARRDRLAKLLRHDIDPVRFSPDLGDDPKRLLEEVRSRGMEGIIAKRRDSLYQPGKRTGAWIKLKCVQEQEFVIGGYTAPAGTRKYFGAMLVGYFEKGKLCFAGKVGTGFNAALLKVLFERMETLRTDTCPFAVPPEKTDAQWCRPHLVAQIRFGEWTSDGKLRQPVFFGLRSDKDTREVTREKSVRSTNESHG
ncbi:MAG TPA: non-homologous end-joining DNA ligase [Chthoniobacterales bacterium]